jgi:hypothetical protein
MSPALADPIALGGVEMRPALAEPIALGGVELSAALDGATSLLPTASVTPKSAPVGGDSVPNIRALRPNVRALRPNVRAL